MKVLLAGDAFVTPQVLSDALHRHLPEAETVTVTNDWPRSPLASIGDVDEAVGDEDALIAALEGVDACFTHTFPFTEKVLAAAGQLRLVTVCRGGPVNVNLEAAHRYGVVVSYTPGRNATATTEHTVAMIMGAVRQIAQRHAELARGEWRGDFYEYDQVPPEVSGSRVGLVGYGAIGSRVAAIMRAMGAAVMVYDPFVDPAQVGEGIELVDSLEHMLPRTNILSIHARLTKENAGLIGADEIGLLPKGSVIVNCARGGLLDYDALCDALDAGHLYAAACDVLPSEPLPPGHRLLSTPRLTMTPHLAGASRGAAELAAELGARDIARFFAGEALEHVAALGR